MADEKRRKLAPSLKAKLLSQKSTEIGEVVEDAPMCMGIAAEPLAVAAEPDLAGRSAEEKMRLDRLRQQEAAQKKQNLLQVGPPKAFEPIELRCSCLNSHPRMTSCKTPGSPKPSRAVFLSYLIITFC